MKKRQDGYVLAYVMVALAFLAALVLIVYTVALGNLKSQQASLERTQQMYAAEGVAERAAAKLAGVSSNEESNQPDAETDFKSKLKGAVNGIGSSGNCRIDDTGRTDNGINLNVSEVGNGTCTFTIVATGSDVGGSHAVVKATIELPVKVTPPSNDDGTTSYTVEVSGPITYNSYDITYETTTEG